MRFSPHRVPVFTSSVSSTFPAASASHMKMAGEAGEVWLWRGCALLLLGVGCVVFARMAQGLLSLAIQIIHASYKTVSKVPPLVARFRKQIDRKLPPGLKQLPTWERVSSRTVRVSGLNPGPHTLQGTNVYLIGQGSTRILVDAGEDVTAEAFVPHLISVMRELGVVALSAILLTHGHHDHQGGVPYLLEKLKKQFPDQRAPSVHKRMIGSGMWDSGDYPAKGFEATHIRDGEEFRTQGATLKAVYTPGHTDDHVAFCLIEDKAIITGDCVLGCGTTVFDNLTQYMESLHHLKEMFIGTQYKHIYPGHGPIIFESGAIKVDEYIAHRSQREREILNLLRQTKKSLKPRLTSWQIVHKMYTDLPIHLKISAQASVLHHLRKLERDGLVRRGWPDLWNSRGSPNED